jgi:hypothetical protein
MTRSTREMSDSHEKFLAELIHGRRMRGSGNQFNGQMDVRNDARRGHHALALDGKCTFGKSLTLTLADLAKAKEQAHAEIPGFGLRWYPDETLRNPTDLIAIWAADFAVILDDARVYRELRKRAGLDSQ